MIAPSSFYIDSIMTAVIASIMLSMLHVFVKPLLIIITLPITVVTFGLFLIVINAFTLKIVDRILGASFDIASFGTAIVAAIFISVLNMLIDNVILTPLSKRD
jgi:putative membrane protein